MLAPSLALEVELCERRIKVIEFLEENYSGEMINYDKFDHEFVRDWLSDYPDVIDRKAFIDAIEQASEFDKWMINRSKAEKE